MSNDDFEELDALFEQALDLPVEERAEFVHSNCPDPDRRARLERLLANAEEATEVFGTGGALGEKMREIVAHELGDENGEDSGDAPRENIPGFELLERIGEGGMGVVWRAEQQGSIQRQVAIKLIKWGMDTREVIARFETERTALALMSHPNIARVFDGGATASGRPYFVMEYVDGQPITSYCDENRLSTTERLELFAKVCDGVQHAHHKGIIHRDLKPTNVLVTVTDGVALPKIIDFGIARAVDQQPTDEDLLTRLGDLIGTPDYMSPEQADPGSVDIDTRTDIYSLGVLLYELLVGVRPFTRSQVRRGIEELRRQILETDPKRPSTRLKELGEQLAPVAAQRSTDTTRLGRRLKGDLDWIAMKALEKDRARRYSSPSELGADIRLHLADQPVTAGPPSRAYRMGKLYRRHRVAVIASVLVALSIALGGAFSTYQAIRATRAEKRALVEAKASRQVTDYLIALFEISDPEAAQGRTVTALELLEEGSARIETDLGESPLIQARVMGAIGEIQRKLGLYDEAMPLVQGALDIQEGLSGEDDGEVIIARRNLAQLHADRGERSLAEPLYREALAAAREKYGEDHLEVARILTGIGNLAYAQSRHDESIASFRESIDIYERLGMAESIDAASSWTGLGAILHRAGDDAGSEKALRRALAIDESIHGPTHPDLIISLSTLASTLGALGRDDEAEEFHRRALEIAERVYGESHNRVAMAASNLAGFHGRQGNLDESQELFERAARIREEIYGSNHPQVAKVYKNLGQLASLRGQYEVSESYLLRALEIDSEALGPVTETVGWDAATLANVYRKTGRFEDSKRYYDQALEVYEATIGKETGDYTRALGGLAMLTLAREQYDEAEKLFRETLELQRRLLPPDHPWLAVTLDGVGDALSGSGKHAEALELHREALVIREAKHGESHPQTARTLARLARESHALGDLSEAEEMYRRALEIQQGALGPDHPDVASLLVGLAEVLDDLGKTSEATQHYREALEIRRAKLDEKHPGLLELEMLVAARRDSREVSRP